MCSKTILDLYSCFLGRIYYIFYIFINDKMFSFKKNLLFQKFTVRFQEPMVSSLAAAFMKDSSGLGRSTAILACFDFSGDIVTAVFLVFGSCFSSVASCFSTASNSGVLSLRCPKNNFQNLFLLKIIDEIKLQLHLHYDFAVKTLKNIHNCS